MRFVVNLTIFVRDRMPDLPLDKIINNKVDQETKGSLASNVQMDNDQPASNDPMDSKVVDLNDHSGKMANHKVNKHHWVNVRLARHVHNLKKSQLYHHSNIWSGHHLAHALRHAALVRSKPEPVFAHLAMILTVSLQCLVSQLKPSHAMMNCQHVLNGMNGVCGVVAQLHAAVVRLSVAASAPVETRTIAKASSWKFVSAMLLNAPHTVNGSSGQRAQSHAAVAVNVNAIAFARLAMPKIALAWPPRQSRAVMATVPCLASGACGAVAQRLAAVVVHGHVVDSVPLAALLTVWVILRMQSHVAKKLAHFTWSGLSGPIAHVHVVEMDVALATDFAHLDVLWIVRERDCPAKVNNVHRRLVQSGNNGRSGSRAVLPVVSDQLTVSDSAQLELWPTVLVIQFNRSRASTQFALLIRHVLHLQCLKSQIVSRP